MLSFVPAFLAFCFAVSSAQILIQGEPVDLPDQILGGKTNVDDVNREDIKDMADFATTFLSSKKNAAVDLVKVVKAQTQVVSGVNYFLTIQMKPAGCYDNCKYEQCDLTIYDQPWTKTREVTHSACKEVSPPVGTLGGEKVNVEDQDVMKAVKFVVDEINKKSNSMYRSSFMKLEHGTKQVVEGLKYKLIFVLGDSVCRNNPKELGSDLKACPLADPHKTQRCSASVWYRNWKTPQYKMLDLKCDQKQASIGERRVITRLSWRGLRVDYKEVENPSSYKGNTVTLEYDVKHQSNKQSSISESVKLDLFRKLVDLTQNDPNKQIIAYHDDVLGNIGSVEKSPLLGQDGHDLCHGGMFRSFQKEHGKVYSSDAEEEKRFGIFCENMKKAAEYQANDEGTAKYGATKFADRTEEEFKAYLSTPWDLSPMADMKQAPMISNSFPSSFDWRDHGAVTAVKNQGSCGSCWAFSTTGNIEGIWKNKKGRLVSLSEQELVDCDTVDQGCSGGLPANAYKQIIKLGGLETEAEYKYTGHGGKCDFIKSDVRVYINNSMAISSDEDQMANWLAQNGPISIGINAFAMQFYMGGIAHPWKIFCNPSKLDHGVLIVGYGKKGSKPFWIIKNSWGPSWGEKGYYYVYRGAGVCGLNTACTSAIID